MKYADRVIYEDTDISTCYYSFTRKVYSILNTSILSLKENDKSLQSKKILNKPLFIKYLLNLNYTIILLSS